MNSSVIIMRLFKYMAPFRAKLSWSIVSSIFNKILDLMPPLLVAWVIDTVSGNPPLWVVKLAGTTEPMSLAVCLTVLSVIIFTLESVFQWAYQYGFMTLSQQVQHHLRLDTYQAMQNREMAFFENHRLGDTLAVLNDDTNQLERFLNNGLNQLIQLVVVMLFALIVMFNTSWQLAVISLIPIPVIIWGSFVYQKRISPRYRRVREAVGALASRIENNISGMLVIKSFTAEKYEYDRVKESSLDYQRHNIDAIKLNALYVPLIRNAISFGFAGVLLLGSYWILSGKNFLTAGELVLFSMLIQRMLWPLTSLGTVLDDFERSKASMRRIFGLLDQDALIKDPVSPVVVAHPKGEISIQNLSFHYPIGGKVLDGLSLEIASGHTIGIAGMTGSGKSTLVKLLFRYYDPTSGHILIDGVDIRQMSQVHLRSMISLVSQDVYLFYGSIFDNIAYGIEGATLESVKMAAKEAALDDFVMSLPDNYSTLVGERGIKLSGGQRQRLSIARAILKNAPIMVFDEATSSVDTETERVIQQNLDRITKGKTAIIIAHRLSTIRHADEIVVLNRCKISERGAHDELLAKKGLYSELWNIQTGESGHKV
jgi:ATP-binding cassette subfamily B protein